MSIVEKIKIFIKKMLKKENNIKQIETYKRDIDDKRNSKFVNSIKIEDTKKEKQNPPIRTRVCVGNGFGIQDKMSG